MTASAKKSSITGMLTCRQVEQFLMNYLEGRLSMLTRFRFNFHLVICKDCRRYLRDYRNTVELGRTIFSNPDDEAAGLVPEEILVAINKARKDG